MHDEFIRLSHILAHKYAQNFLAAAGQRDPNDKDLAEVRNFVFTRFRAIMGPDSVRSWAATIAHAVAIHMDINSHKRQAPFHRPGSVLATSRV